MGWVEGLLVLMALLAAAWALQEWDDQRRGKG